MGSTALVALIGFVILVSLAVTLPPESQGEDELPPARDCEVSEWSAWKVCPVLCGTAKQSRVRTVTVNSLCLSHSRHRTPILLLRFQRKQSQEGGGRLKD